jgi:DnaJ-class molecular chaperone
MSDKRQEGAITPGSPAVNPGDETAPGTAQTAENTCRRCNGTGSVQGQPCPDCGGTGRVTEIVGDA